MDQTGKKKSNQPQKVASQFMLLGDEWDFPDDWKVIHPREVKELGYPTCQGPPRAHGGCTRYNTLIFF